MVKRRNTEDFGRRKRQPLADVVQGPWSKPAEAVLHGVQRRKKKVALRSCGMTCDFNWNGTQNGIDGGALGGVGLGTMNANIHYFCSTFSTRTAAALNSAVPDLGSVASIVRRLVATSSGKWRVINVSPRRNE